MKRDLVRSQFWKKSYRMINNIINNKKKFLILLNTQFVNFTLKKAPKDFFKCKNYIESDLVRTNINLKKILMGTFITQKKRKGFSEQ